MAKRINLNKFAQDITECEHLKKQVNIAQIKEIIKCVFIKLADCTPEEVDKTIDYYGKKYNK